MSPLPRFDVNVALPATQPLQAPSAFLEYLRGAAMACRIKPRAYLFEACALLQTDPAASRAAHADALMRCLPEALGKKMHLRAPGVVEMTFDEAWLTQLGRAHATKDEVSARFLLGSRVAFEHRRLVRFLIGQISDDFTLH